MILVDALHINNGGGLSLLTLLIEKLEEAGANVFYLLDTRAKIFLLYTGERKYVSEAGIINRMSFYRKNARRFKCIFCFANFPPLVRHKAKTITYFQNVLLISDDISLKGNFVGWMKKQLLLFTRSNTDLWYVQTLVTKDKLLSNFKDQVDKIKVLPFWDPEFFKITVKQEKDFRFLYISDGHPHKNHNVLLQAWEQLFDLGYILSLVLTVNFAYLSVCKQIEILQKKGLKIVNKGLVAKNDIKQLYAENSITIYPSLNESFGLGIIEAVSAGHNIIASNLDYVKSIINASAYFNPSSADDIVSAIISIFKNNNANKSELLVRNCLDELINELKTF